MALFGRGKHGRGEHSRAQPVDPTDRVRTLMREALAERGVEVIAHADHLEAADGFRYGLTNIVAACRSDPRGEKAWPELVRGHVDGLLSGGEDRLAQLTRDEVLATTYLRVMPSIDVPPKLHYGRELAAGLTEVLNVDLPQTIAYLNDDQVAEYGPLDELRAAGAEHLRQVPWEGREPFEHEGGRLEIISGESFFVASMVLVMPEVLRRLEVLLDPEAGVFVALPNRNHLIVHVVADASAVASLNLMTMLASGMYDDLPGIVSPDAYWWRPSGLVRVSERGETGINVTVDAELAAVLDRVSG